MSFDRPLDPQSIIFVQNWSPLTSYGHSLLQSCKARLTQRNELINAAVMAAKNHANPICMLMHELPAEMVVDDKLTRNERRSLKEQAKLVDNGQSRWVVGVGHGKYTIATVGHTALPNSTDLLDRLTQDIITSCGLSPSSMGMHLGSGKGVTTFNSSNQMTINTIVTKQRNLIQQLQLKLYSILPLIETATPPGEICIKMQEPTAESVKEKYEAESIKIDNAIMLGKAGVISGETAAHELGYDELEDNDKWQKMTEPQLAPENPNDPNTQQQKRAAITNAKKPGNNPAGSKN